MAPPVDATGFASRWTIDPNRSVSKPRRVLNRYLNDDEQKDKGQIQGEPTDPQRWDDPAERFQKGVGDRVDDLEQDDERAPGAKVSAEVEDPADDRPTDEQDRQQPQQRDENGA